MPLGNLAAHYYMEVKNVNKVHEVVLFLYCKHTVVCVSQQHVFLCSGRAFDNSIYDITYNFFTHKKMLPCK